MNFEQELIQFLQQLVADGIIVDGSLIGVSEEKRTGTAIARFLDEDDVVRERYLAFFESESVLVWKLLEVLKVN